MQESAQIIAGYGRRFLVKTAAGAVLDAMSRAKRVDYVCGDRVSITRLNETQAVIEQYAPRESLLYRQDNQRSKLIAANVTQMVLVTAAIPAPSEYFIQRALVAAEAAGMAVLMVVNKADLQETLAFRERLVSYENMGYRVMLVSAKGDIQALRGALQGHSNILLGQSGMGKSTLTNVLLGRDTARVGDISAAQNVGRHTTTHARLYDLAGAGSLIDSPGLQSFGLHHIKRTDLVMLFPDLRDFAGGCRFHNCSHDREPHCALKDAAASGAVSTERWAFFQALWQELPG